MVTNSMAVFRASAKLEDHEMIRVAAGHWLSAIGHIALGQVADCMGCMPATCCSPRSVHIWYAKAHECLSVLHVTVDARKP